jgi:hypothetical protein
MCYTRTINRVTSLHLLKPPDFMKANNRVKYVAQAPFMEQVILTFSDHMTIWYWDFQMQVSVSYSNIIW